MSFKGLIVSGTTDVVRANQRWHSLQRDLPQLCDDLGGSSLTLAVLRSLARHRLRHKL